MIEYPAVNAVYDRLPYCGKVVFAIFWVLLACFFGACHVVYSYARWAWEKVGR